MADLLQTIRKQDMKKVLYTCAFASVCFERATGLSTSQFCTGITSVNNLQDAISAKTLGPSVCVKFIGDSVDQYGPASLR